MTTTTATSSRPATTPHDTREAREARDATRGPSSALDISPELEQGLEDVLTQAQRFGASLRDTVLAQRPSDADRLIESAVASTQRLLGKWKLEILYSLTLTESARFSELRRRLGTISSRTLSNKLKELEEDGYLQRTVTTTRPLRVDYTLTPEGLRIAALTSPLIAYLNHNQRPRQPLSQKPPEAADEDTPHS
jgi:DNA-binding HxlR family transcriptional regulator